MNYAPIRLGAVVRVWFHNRIDGVRVLTIMAWFAFIGFTLLIVATAALAATLLREETDGWTIVIAIAVIIAGGFALRGAVALPPFRKYGVTLEAMASNPGVLWGAIVLRVLDFATYAGRMAAAAAILSIDLSISQVAILAVVALWSGLIPVGRLGFREFCVAAVASQLSLAEDTIEDSMSRLALVESAGEAIFLIPVGAILLLRLRHVVVHGRRETTG